MPRFLTIWLPRWPVQRRLLARPELRRVPLFVCRRERRGTMTVASWAWAEPPPDERRKRVVSGRGGRVVIPSGMSLAEAPERRATSLITSRAVITVSAMVRASV